MINFTDCSQENKYNIFLAYDFNRIPVNLLISRLKSLKYDLLIQMVKLMTDDLKEMIIKDIPISNKYLIIYQIINWFNSKELIAGRKIIPLDEIINLHLNQKKKAFFFKKVKILSPISKIYNIINLCKNYNITNKVLNINGSLMELKNLVKKTCIYLDMNFNDFSVLSNYLVNNFIHSCEAIPPIIDPITCNLQS